MKKQTKGKRTPPRRKPVKASKLLREQRPHRPDGITQEMRDEAEAYSRAMLDRMPPEVREEYLHLNQIDDGNLSPEDDARLEEIHKEHDHYPPPEIMDRHLADIAREREQKTAQDQQAETTI